eukprot:728727-Rhodomonas_salina.1
MTRGATRPYRKCGMLPTPPRMQVLLPSYAYPPSLLGTDVEYGICAQHHRECDNTVLTSGYVGTRGEEGGEVEREQLLMRAMDAHPRSGCFRFGSRV